MFCPIFAAALRREKKRYGGYTIEILPLCRVFAFLIALFPAISFHPTPMHRIPASNLTKLSKPFFFLASIPKSNFSSASSSTFLQSIPRSETKLIVNPLYHFLPQNQNPFNIVELVSSHLKTSNTQLSLLQSDIKELLPHLGHREISKIILRCQSNFVSVLAFFNWVKFDLGITLNSQNYCLIIHILAWSRQFSMAMKFLSELIELSKDNASGSEDVFHNLVLCTEHCNWNPVIFEMLMKAYVKVHMIQESYESFKKMVKMGFVPSVIACNCILNGLAKMKCDAQCWELYEEMGRIGVHSNAYTFNILTYVLCRAGDVNKVNEFLEKMEEEGFDPDVVTYNTLIDSYCRRGRLDDAFYLYRIMFRRGVMPDLVSYTSLMNGLCKLGRVREAHQLFHRMIDRELDPDVVLYNTLINAYCKDGRLQEARSLLHDMTRIGICPDSFTCRIMVEGYGRGGSLISALNLVVELRKLGTIVTYDIYDYLIVSLCLEDRPFAAKSVLERVIKDGFQPNACIYNKLIECFCRVHNVSEALLLKSEMIKRNFKLSIDSYKPLISCLCGVNRSVDGEGLMVEMVESGVLPDHQICRVLINGYCKEGNVYKAESLLVSFAKDFEFFDTESFNALVKFHRDFGNETELMQLQDRMLKVGFVPNSLTCRYVIHGLWKSARLDKRRVQAPLCQRG